ncbi:hypothetical protein BJ165DRAFT_1533630 [Panaeolus papilionaceus]|nr:hypothetical protein BJ165DRAFT_1533630 [Panaeolus papilionaceus]
MILPYGVTPAPLGQRNTYNSPFNIRSLAFWSRDLAYLGSKGFSVRASDSDGFIFDDNWSEDRVFHEISLLLPNAAKTLNETHDPVKNGPRKWLPCSKVAYSGKFVVSPADGPYTGSVMRNIAISGNQRVSTTKIRISDDDDLVISDDESSVPSAQPSRSTATSHKPAKSRSSSTQHHRSAPPSSRQLRPRIPKKVDVISIADDDSDFESFALRICKALSRHLVALEVLQPELPAEADYCWLSS